MAKAEKNAVEPLSSVEPQSSAVKMLKAAIDAAVLTLEERVAIAKHVLEGVDGVRLLIDDVLEEESEGSEKTSPELSLEVKAWFAQFKARFNALPQLHRGIKWRDVEKLLRADLVAMEKLRLLDEKGHEMNVFGEQNGEIIFRSAQTDVTKIAAGHRTIMYDNRDKTDYQEYHANGNAKQLAADLGVEVADPELYEEFRVKKGWVWLKTDAKTRSTGGVFVGNCNGVYEDECDANYHYAVGSFCAALRVKKALVLQKR